MDLSINTIMMAMFSVHRDIKYHERLNNDELLEQVEREDHGQYVLDLTQAFNELGMVYEEARVEVPEFPPVAELLNQIDNS